MRALLDHLHGVVAVELKDPPGHVVRLVRLETVVLCVDSSEELVSAQGETCDVDPLEGDGVSVAIALADRDAHLHGERGGASHDAALCTPCWRRAGKRCVEGVAVSRAEALLGALVLTLTPLSVRSSSAVTKSLTCQWLWPSTGPEHVRGSPPSSHGRASSSPPRALPRRGAHGPPTSGGSASRTGSAAGVVAAPGCSSPSSHRPPGVEEDSVSRRSPAQLSDTRPIRRRPSLACRGPASLDLHRWPASHRWSE